jgi:Mn2+/Fe2+ NRAMP family transporter
MRARAFITSIYTAVQQSGLSKGFLTERHSPEAQVFIHKASEIECTPIKFKTTLADYARTLRASRVCMSIFLCVNGYIASVTAGAPPVKPIERSSKKV